MRVAFITCGQENMGVEFLSAQLKKHGHEVRLFFDPRSFGGGVLLKIGFLEKMLDLREKIVKQSLEWKPDIVGFSCMTHNYQWCLSVAKEIKKRANMPVIFGGIHPTLLPQEVLSQDCVDMVAVGEAEVSFPKLLSNMARGIDSADTKGIYFKRGGRIVANPIEPPSSDLDSFEFLDKDIFYAKIFSLARMEYTAMASRGCPFACFYCSNDYLRKLYKGYSFSRKRSVGHLVSELKQAKEKYGMRGVVFYDEVFPSEVSWLEEFSREYKREIDLPFTIFYHFGLCDEKRIELLRNAGCTMISFGLQSASERVRREVCNRAETNAQVSRIIQLCKKHKMQIWIDHIFGLPTESDEETRSAAAFYRELSPDIIYSFWLVYFPRASILGIALQAGILGENEVEKINSGQVGYYYKGMFVKNRKYLLKYQLLFDLIPLVPARWHRKISENKIAFRMLPGGLLPHLFLLLIVAIKLRQKLIFSRFELLFSKKSLP